MHSEALTSCGSDFLSDDQSPNYTDFLQGHEPTSDDTDEANEELAVSEDLGESADAEQDDELMARLIDAFMRLQEDSFTQNADLDVSEMFDQDGGADEQQDTGKAAFRGHMSTSSDSSCF